MDFLDRRKVFGTHRCCYRKVDSREILRVLRELGGLESPPRSAEIAHETAVVHKKLR